VTGRPCTAGPGARAGWHLSPLCEPSPRDPADLTEHAPLLDKLVAIRRGHRLGDGDLQHIGVLVQLRIAEGHGHEGLTGILDSRG
jgi:hypothetical protein